MQRPLIYVKSAFAKSRRKKIVSIASLLYYYAYIWRQHLMPLGRCYRTHVGCRMLSAFGWRVYGSPCNYHHRHQHINTRKMSWPVSYVRSVRSWPVLIVLAWWAWCASAAFSAQLFRRRFTHTVTGWAECHGVRVFGVGVGLPTHSIHSTSRAGNFCSNAWLALDRYAGI